MEFEFEDYREEEYSLNRMVFLGVFLSDENSVESFEMHSSHHDLI